MPTDPRRRAEHHTEKELDAMAEVSAEDVERAVAAWNRDAPKAFKGLLDAAPDDGPTDSEGEE